jgi:hypothetical protein
MGHAHRRTTAHEISSTFAYFRGISLTGERAQATLRGRPRGRLGRAESGKGCVRGRPRRFGSIQGAGATLKLSNSEMLQT